MIAVKLIIIRMNPMRTRYRFLMYRLIAYNSFRDSWLSGSRSIEGSIRGSRCIGNRLFGQIGILR